MRNPKPNEITGIIFRDYNIPVDCHLTGTLDSFIHTNDLSRLPYKVDWHELARRAKVRHFISEGYKDWYIHEDDVVSRLTDIRVIFAYDMRRIDLSLSVLRGEIDPDLLDR